MAFYPDNRSLNGLANMSMFGGSQHQYNQDLLAAQRAAQQEAYYKAQLQAYPNMVKVGADVTWWGNSGHEIKASPKPKTFREQLQNDVDTWLKGI